MQLARKPLALLALEAAALVPPLLLIGIREPLWTLAVPTVLLITLIVTLLWPSAGRRGYFSYRTPVVVAAFVAELWIVVGGLTLQLPADPRTSDWWFSGFLVVFFLLTAINSLPGLTGEYRSGAGLRPDLIFGGGAYLVRGEIFVALGIEFLTTKPLAHPVWNWWAVVAEITAMLIVIAFRGILKLRMRRARLLGLDTWMGAGPRAGVWLREVFLYLGLFFVVYAFANMYLGRIPFTWAPGERHGPGWWGLAWLAAAFLVLVPVRGWLKTRLPEPPTLRQELGKQLLMWIGFLLLVYGFVVLFDGRLRPIHGFDYFNFWWGFWVSALGFLMVVPLRTITLREEFRGTIRIMTGLVAEIPDHEQRTNRIAGRLETIASLPERARVEQLALTMAAADRLTGTTKEQFVAGRDAAFERLPEHRRAILAETRAAVEAQQHEQETQHVA